MVLLSGAETYNELTDRPVRTFLEDRCKESEETVKLEQLGKVVQQKLRTITRNKNATNHMQDRFTTYHTLTVHNAWNAYRR